MERKRGAGMVFINCMEKLTMNAPKETLRVRLRTAMDHGIDGITLAAGLHLGSFALIEDHPRFRDVQAGHHRPRCARCSSSSRRARAPTACPTTWWSKARWPAATSASAWTGRSTTWPPSSPRSATGCGEQIDIPLIPAGGIFTGTDAVAFLEAWRGGRAGGDALHRVTKECGLPDDIKQDYFKANEDDIEVNGSRPPATRCAC
jgi:nitronate monooxygenase